MAVAFHSAYECSASVANVCSMLLCRGLRRALAPRLRGGRLSPSPRREREPEEKRGARLRGDPHPNPLPEGEEPEGTGE